MAQIFATATQIVGDSSIGDIGVIGWDLVWANITNGDTPVPVSAYGGYADKSFQAEGTFGGTSVSIQGSNDGANYHPLNDPTGVTIGLTQGGLKEVLEHTRYLVPALTGGAGSSITATLFVRKTQAK